MKKKEQSILDGRLLALVLGACGQKAGSKRDESVQDFYPITPWSEVSGDLNDVRMIQSVVEFHSYEPQ